MSPDANHDPKDDLAPDAEQLRARYDSLAQGGAWGEHPDHLMEEWEADVRSKKTRLGYWDWVATKVRPEDSKTDADPALAEAEEEEFEELQAEDPGNQGA
jgi:hypothetical protein